MRKGRRVADVADAFGVTERTLYRWLARYASEGQRGLETRSRSAPQRVKPGQRSTLQTSRVLDPITIRARRGLPLAKRGWFASPVGAFL